MEHQFIADVLIYHPTYIFREIEEDDLEGSILPVHLLGLLGESMEIMMNR